MTSLERKHTSTDLASLDLDTVEKSRRAAAWTHSAQSFFPGLKVEVSDSPKRGSMKGMPLGSGSLWTIQSPPIAVEYRPNGSIRESDLTFSVMLQLEGSTLVAQNHHSCLLHEQDLCLVDGRSPFDLRVSDPYSYIVFMRIPRHTVLSRYSYLKDNTAECISGDDYGAILLRSTLLSVLQNAPLMHSDQRGAALGAVARLLGAPRMKSSENRIGWRTRAALTYIDANLSDPELTADRVAADQRISRRRLDELLLNSVGKPLAAQIWERRLTQAASDLVDPAYASKTVTQVAFSAGFKNAAHFTRAFKKQYGRTPCEWRSRETTQRVS